MSTTSRLPTALEVRGLTKTFGGFTAVDTVDVRVAESEFLTLLGPSGSGKTTMLRMIAGFAAPSAGSIELEGRDITNAPPNKRGIGMVFQNYALFPHLTAAQNVAFPLEMRRIPRREIRKRVDGALELVHLEGLGGRRPRELSGGQQQRVALARAIVFDPRLLLMDEPLGALDRQLREALQLEVLRIRRRLGVTVVYVTHDQEEALAMSDRIAVFNRGRIEQVGRAEELYRSPKTLFVATFVGESTILTGRYGGSSTAPAVDGSLGRWRIEAPPWLPEGGARVALVIRPERLKISTRELAMEDPYVDATVAEVLYLGSTRKYDLALANGTRALVREQTTGSDARHEVGAEVRLTWRPGDAAVVPLSDDTIDSEERTLGKT